MPSKDPNDLVPYLKEVWECSSEKWNSTRVGEVFLTCTHRSNEEQTKLYAQGRTAPGKVVTNAKAGQSKHNKKPSEAFDVAFRWNGKTDWSSKNFKAFAKMVKEDYPLVKWGGDFKSIVDMPHFEV